jgi:hypothetical protein
VHSDPKKQAAQVQFMSQIYERASQVVVWLGPTGTDMTNPVAYLDHLTTNTLNIPPISYRELDDIVEENEER